MEVILSRLSLDDPYFTHLNLSEVDVDDEYLQLIVEKLRNNTYINRVTWKEGYRYNSDLKQQIDEKIELNNQNLQLHPTDFVHGLLSCHAYSASKVSDSVQLQGCEETWNEELKKWKVIKVFNPNDESRYYGAAYLNEKGKQIVLAHRGTTIQFLDFLKPDSPLKNDLDGILGGKIVSHQKHAYVATKEIIEYAQKKRCSLSFTGHSLGAWLAELSLYHAVYDFEYFKSKAVTFDSPGSAPAMESLRSNVKSSATERDIENLDITTYLSAPNLVNVCNPHIGNVYRIFPKITWAKTTDTVANKMEKIPIAKCFKPFFMGLLSVVGHSLIPMIATFKLTTGKPVKFKKVLDWPCIKFNIASLNKTFGKSTYWTVLKLVSQCVKGNFERQQFFEVYKFLETNAKEGYPLSETKLLCSEEQFILLYKVHYRVEVLNLSEDLYNMSRISDRYLDKLCQVGTDEIDHTDIDSKLKQALKNLKSKYKIKIKFSSGKKYICADSSDIQIDNLRGEIMKLCDTYPKVKETLENENAYSLPNENRSEMIISNLPVLSIHIIDRLEVQREIEEVFKKRNVVVIWAFAGFGKSTIAKIYGHCLQNNFSDQVVRFIDAESLTKINAEYKQIADDLKISNTNETAENIMHWVHSKIAKLGLSVLFIFDNVEKFEDVEVYLDEIYNLKKCKVIITTRHSHLSKDLMNIELKPFTKEEATSYVENSLRSRWSGDIVDLINKLSKDNFVWPYRLSHAVTYLYQHNTYSVEDYMEELEKTNDKTGTYLLFNVINTSKLSWYLLQYSAYLDPDFISLNIFKELLSADKGDLQDVVNELEGLSLISSRPSQHGYFGFQIHRLAQDMVRKYIAANKYAENKIDEQIIFDEVMKVLNTLFPMEARDLKEIQVSRILYPHAIKMVQNPLTIHYDKRVEMSELYDKLGFYSRSICEFAQALKYHKKALEIKQALYSEQNTLSFPISEFPELPIHPDIAASLNFIGFDYYLMDENYSDIEYFEAAYKIRQELHSGKNHPDIARSLCNIGTAFGDRGCPWRKGDKEKALKYNLEALEMLQTLYRGENSARISRALFEVGTSYRHKGDEEKALKYFMDALKMAQTMYPQQNHDDTALYMSTVGIVYSEKGAAAKGVKYLEDALKMKQALHPKQNRSDVAGCFNNLAMCYLYLGEITKSVKNSEAGLRMVQVMYNGQFHSEVAAYFCNLGFIYLKLGYIEKSVEYAKQSYQIDRRIIDGHIVQNYMNLFESVKSCLGHNNMEFLKGDETREIIIQRGSFDESTVQIWRELYDKALIPIYNASLIGKWSEPSVFRDLGVSGYLHEKYLRQKLGRLSNSKTIETAKMLCFEAICLGIMRCESEYRDFKCVKEFVNLYPKTIEKIIIDHPEYFIDGSILRQCVRDPKLLNKLLANVNPDEN